jgi:hypothetical protein
MLFSPWRGPGRVHPRRCDLDNNDHAPMPAQMQQLLGRGGKTG